MFTTATSSSSRIARFLKPSRVLPIALVFLVADLALTAALLGLAVEANPIAAWLFESVGVTTTGILAVGLVTAAYVGLGRSELDRHGRARLLVSGGLLAVLVVPVVWNTAIWLRLGTPDVAVAVVAETIAPVVIAGVVAVLATTVDAGEVPSPEREEVVSVFFSVIMVTSMIGGVAFVGTQPLNDQKSGEVSASSSGNVTVYGSGDSEIDIFNGGDGSLIDNIPHADGGYLIELKDGPILSVSGGDIHEFKGNELDGTYEYNDSEGLADLTQNKDGSVLYLATNNREIIALSTDDYSELWRYATGNDQGINSVTYDPIHEEIYISQNNGYLDRISAGGDELASGEIGGTNDPNLVETQYVESKDSVVVVRRDGFIGFVERSDLSFIDNVEVSNEFTEEAEFTQGAENLYGATSTGIIYKFDVLDEEEKWNEDVHEQSSIRDLEIHEPSESIYVHNQEPALSKTTFEGSVQYNVSTEEAYPNIAVVSSFAGSASAVPEWEDQAPLLRAVDQNGDPVRNASIEAWSVDAESLSDEVEDKEAEAEEILNELDDVQPDRWEPPTQVDLSYGDLTDLYDGEQPDGTYPTAHTEADMGIAGWTDTHDLIPRLEFDSGETIHLYAWDADAGANMGPTSDGVTSEHYGEIADDPTFNLQRLGPDGETLDNNSVTATQTYSGGIPPLSYEHDYATVDVPDGYYLVSVEGSDTPGYVIKVGEASSVLTTELRDEADQLTQQAEQLQSYLGEDTMTKDRVTATNRVDKGAHTQDGIPPIDTSKFDYGWGYVNPGVGLSGDDPTNLESNRNEEFPQISSSEIFLQGYRGPNVGVDEFEDRNVEDILKAAENIDEPIYATTEPKRVDLREIDDPNNATIEVELQKFDTGLNPDVGEFENKTEELRNQLLNESTAELESLFRDNPDLLDEAELETRHDELEDLIESNNDLEERVEELRDAENIEDVEDATNEQLKDDLAAMEQALAELEGQLEAEEPSSEIDSGEIFAQFPFADDLNPDAITVVANYEDGSSEVISDEYWTVESSGILGGDQVTVDGLEIADDRAVADLEVKGVSTDGDLGTSRDSVTNPSYQGDIPELDAIDMSTLRPGVGDVVRLTLRSSDESFDGTSDVTVYDPDGQQLNVTQNDERFSWSPEETGTHTVRATYTNDIGGEFTETVRIAARESTSSSPPTVRITEGIGGEKALAGDGLESASINIDGDSASIVAQAPGGESPSQIDIRAEQLSVDELDVSIVSGENQRSVDRHVSVRVRAQFGAESLVWHPDAPITADGDTVAGEWETRSDDDGSTHQVIDTYTDADGTTSIEVNRDPGIIDRVQHRFAVSSPFSLPFLMTAPMQPAEAALTLMDSYTPMIDEATPGEIVFGPTDMTAAATGVTA